MVAISIAKQRGANAVSVAGRAHHHATRLQQEVLPPHIRVGSAARLRRETANDKANNLASSLAFAIFTVVLFIGLFSAGVPPWWWAWR